MKPKLEYHVFCQPIHSEIAAIFQYRWFEPWYYSSLPQQGRASVPEKIVEGIKAIHQRIMAHPAMTEQLKGKGLSSM